MSDMPDNSKELTPQDLLRFQVRIIVAEIYTCPSDKHAHRHVDDIMELLTTGFVTAELKAAAGRLDEAKYWNQLCHERDIERITHDYFVELRDRRIDQLIATKPPEEQ